MVQITELKPRGRGEPPHYVAASTGERFAIDRPLWRAPDGSHLNLTPGPGLARADIVTGERSLWRYAAAIRVDASQRISLGEGWTPLVEKSWGPARAHFKLEYVSPTGSFKDRGMTVLMTYLAASGVAEVLEDSSGNAGASMAAYAAAAGIHARILSPAAAPKAKIVQMTAMGADVALVPGTRQDVSDAALREAEHRFYASHNWQPFFLEGTKTLAFELWEQFGFQAPDAVVVPTGYGSNVLGLWLGFNELAARGLSRIPRIYLAQAENCAAFDLVFRSGGDAFVPFAPQPTAADGIATVRPVRIAEVMQAVRGSGGAALAVSEGEIAAALKRLLGAGLFVEPTSAVAGAALERLLAAGTVRPDERVAVILTGSGMKATDKIGELVGNPAASA